MTAAPTFDHYQPQSPAALHAKNNLKAWWKQFTSAQRPKKETGGKKRVYCLLSPSSMFPNLSTHSHVSPATLAHGPKWRFR